jgi:hypothetical protein
MQPTEIDHYLKQILRSSSHITNDEAVLLAHAITQLTAQSSPHQKTILDVLDRVRRSAEATTVATNLYDSLNNRRGNATYAFVARFAKRRYIYENVDYYFSEDQVLFERGDEYDAVFPVKQPFAKAAPALGDREGRFYLDRLTYNPQSDSFVIESIPQIDEWVAKHVEPFLRDHNLLARHYGRAARVPTEVIDEWIQQLRDVKEFYIPGHSDVSTFNDARSSDA